MDNNNLPYNQAPQEVHTMPDKFINKSSGNFPVDNNLTQPTKASKASWIIIVVIIIAVLAILGGAGFLIFTNMPSEDTQQLVQAGQVNENVTTNGNANSNGNSNKNANLNNNQNANQNKNSNTNQNKNSNENSNTNNSNANNNTNLNKPINVKMAKDTDIDGLTAEEEKLYSTKDDKPDSDSDGYKDGDEIIHGYSPVGAEKMEQTELVKTYTNPDFNFSILYPSQWILSEMAEDKRNIFFMPNSEKNAGENIEVIVENNPYGSSAQEWYLDQNKGVVASQVPEIEINGQKAIISIDGYTLYFTNSDYVFAVSYSFGMKEELNFISTFKMMYNSFKLNKKAKKVDNNANTNATTNQNTNKQTNSNSNS